MGNYYLDIFYPEGSMHRERGACAKIWVYKGALHWDRAALRIVLVSCVSAADSRQGRIGLHSLLPTPLPPTLESCAAAVNGGVRGFDY